MDGLERKETGRKKNDNACVNNGSKSVVVIVSTFMLKEIFFYRKFQKGAIFVQQ